MHSHGCPCHQIFSAFCFLCFGLNLELLSLSSCRIRCRVLSSRSCVRISSLRSLSSPLQYFLGCLPNEGSSLLHLFDLVDCDTIQAGSAEATAMFDARFVDTTAGKLAAVSVSFAFWRNIYQRDAADSNRLARLHCGALKFK